MRNKENKMIAPCGIDCSKCNILLASDNPEIAMGIVNWLKEKKNMDIKVENVRCGGCKGDRTKHWHPDCSILKCCVDEKGLEFCYECVEFPCKKLTEWAENSKVYAESFNRLKEMKNNCKKSKN